MLLLGAFFLKEAVPRRGWFQVALVVAGTALLSAGDIGGGRAMLLGDLLALTGGVCVALYILIGRSVRARINLVPYTFLVYGISAVVLLLIMLVSEVPLTGYPSGELMLFFALALFCTIGGHSLYNYALRYLTAGLVSVSVLMEPVIATLLALILFQEMTAPFSLAGAVLIVYGISRYAGARR